MNEAKLILDIGADVSQFEYSLAQVRSEIKRLTKDIQSVTGKELVQIGVQITGLERTRDTLERFSQFGENTLGALINQIKTLEKERLEINIGDTDKLVEYNRRIDLLIAAKKELLSNKNITTVTPLIDPNTIAGLQAKLKQVTDRTYRIDITDENELARLNTQANELRQQIARLQGLSFDSKGTLQKGAAKARQSLVNLGLVAQDLPFGFIAIQNNIPNLINSFGELANEAKTTGVSIGSQLASQLKGGAGAILGIGLAVSALTATITYLIQKYGSLSAAFDALFGKVNPLANVIKRADKALKDFADNFITAGEAIAKANASAETQIVRLEALGITIQDVTASERARQSALEELKRIDNDRFGRYDLESSKLQSLTGDIQEYTNAVLAKAVAEKLGERTAEALAAREIKRNLYGENIKDLDNLRKEYPKLEKTIADFQQRNKDYLNSLKKGVVSGIAPSMPDEVKKFYELSTAISTNEKELISLNDVYEESRGVFKNATLESLKFGESLTSFSKKKPKKIKIEFDYDLPKLEEFLIAEEFYDPRKSLSRLEEYADIVLDVSKKESERTEALAALNKESQKVTNGSFKLFETFKIGTTSTKDIQNAVESYGFELQRLIIALLEAEKKSKIKFKFELPKLDKFLQDIENFFAFEESLKRLEDVGQIILDPKSTIEERTKALQKLQKEQKLVFDQDAKYFDNLEIGISSTEEITNAIIGFGNALQEALIGKKQITELFDSKEIKNQIESIKELTKGLPKELVPDFKEFEDNLIKTFTLEFLKKGKPIDLTYIKDQIDAQLLLIKDSVIKSQISNAIADIFGGDQGAVKITEQINKIVEGIKGFRESIAQNLQRPFEEFFDGIIEKGEASLESFFKLFKDVLKRISAQIISSGIANLITQLLLPKAAVTKSITGVATGKGGPTGFLKLITDLFAGPRRSVNDVNFGGVGGGGMKLAGEVVFVQRGSDLIGAINRTNATINRVG